jgi:hypothetical protein
MQKKLGKENLSAEERGRLAALQYGAKLSQPAVMELNARASSHGALILRQHHVHVPRHI